MGLSVFKERVCIGANMFPFNWYVSIFVFNFSYFYFQISFLKVCLNKFCVLNILQNIWISLLYRNSWERGRCSCGGDGATRPASLLLLGETPQPHHTAPTTNLSYGSSVSHNSPGSDVEIGHSSSEWWRPARLLLFLLKGTNATVQYSKQQFTAGCWVDQTSLRLRALILTLFQIKMFAAAGTTVWMSQFWPE